MRRPTSEARSAATLMRSDAPYAAAVYRSPFLAIAVMGSSEVLEVLCSRAPSPKVRLRRVLSAARAYSATTVVLEPNCPLGEMVPCEYEVFELGLRAAMEQLIPESSPKCHADLFRRLLERHPSLRRFMSMSADGSRILMLDRWKNVRMLPIAIGIAVRFGARAKPVRLRRSRPISVHSSHTICATSSPEVEKPAPTVSSASLRMRSGTRPENSSDASATASAEPSSTSSAEATTSSADATPPSPMSTSTG